MGRPKKQKTEQSKVSLVLSQTEVKEPSDLEKMPLETLEDYIAYNAEARRLNNKLKIYRYPMKQCPRHLHPQETIEISNILQPTSKIPAFLVNAIIDFKEDLYPGVKYRLPRMIVEHLSGKGEPIWEVVDKPDGSKDTIRVGFKPRFSIRTIYENVDDAASF